MSVGDQNTEYDINSKVYDEVIDSLDNNGVTFVTSFDIPYLAGSSKTGKTIYRDKHTPPGYNSKNGVWVDTDRYIKVHERVEKIFLDKGFPYKLAHQIATRLEYSAVETDGYDVEEYDNVTQKWVDEAQKRATYFVPFDLEMKPYIECNDPIIQRMIPVKNIQNKASDLLRF